MRFLQTNLCTETATVRTASSSHVNFPVSNLANPLRSKRWRSSGTFVIDATNNKIDFKESGGGAQLHATITSGSYTPTTLAAEIKTQLQAAGSQIYTVTYSTNIGTWTIESDGAYLSILNLTGTNNATALLTVSLGFPVSDKTGATTYTGSLVAIHTKEYVLYDMLTSQDINSVVLFWPKEDGIKLTGSAVVKIEANATNVWTSPAVSQTLTIDSDYLVASHFFSSVQSYRYWRVTIQDPQNAYLYVELGLSWIGENVTFSEPENGFKYSITDMSDVVRTDFGHQYVDEYPQLAVLEFNYNYVQYATAQALENAFRLSGNRKPVLVAFDETATVFNKNHFLIYGTMDKTFGLNHVSYDMFNGGLKITELG